jgi:hypothetical protein
VAKSCFTDFAKDPSSFCPADPSGWKSRVAPAAVLLILIISVGNPPGILPAPIPWCFFARRQPVAESPNRSGQTRPGRALDFYSSNMNRIWNWQTIKQEWFSNLRGDILAGMVVALALIPEAIAFSIIAGVDPKVGLYASFCIAVVSAFVGGRPAMISAATAATALLMVTLVKEHGLQYLLVATHWRHHAIRLAVGHHGFR